MNKRFNKHLLLLATIRISSINSNYFFIVSTGYIDLSKRRVAPEDIIKCEEKYNKSKAVSVDLDNHQLL
jgi:hypothetical protein